jgi:hypothetical protein
MLSVSCFLKGIRKFLPALMLAVSFCAAAQAQVARSNYTMTLLPDGKILIAGGDTAGATSNCASGSSAELYNPSTQLYTSTVCFENSSNADVTISSHTAVLLPNGTVMIAGGLVGGTPSTDIFIYNPNTRTLTLDSTSLTYARSGHTATLMKNGNVLIAGGMNSSGKAVGDTTDDPGESSFEIYVPSSNSSSSSISATGDLVTARWGHTATQMPGGKVFITGGYNPSSVIVSTYNYLNLSELYDPSTNTAIPAAPLARARAFHTATAMNDGSVLIVGGYNQSNTDTNGNYTNNFGFIDTVERYTGGQTMETAAAMPGVAIMQHAALLDTQGEVLIYGGLGILTTQYFDTSYTILTSTISLALYANAVSSGTIDKSSSILLNVDKTLGVPVTGIIKNGYMMFSGPPPAANTHWINNNDAYLDFYTAYSSETYVNLQNAVIYQGIQTLQTNLLSNDASNMGTVTFEPQSETVTVDASVSCTSDTTIASGTSGSATMACTLASPKFFVAGTDYVAQGSYAKAYSGKITGGTLTWTILNTLTNTTSNLTVNFSVSTINNFSSLSESDAVQQDALGNFFFAPATVSISKAPASIVNSTWSDLAAGTPIEDQGNATYSSNFTPSGGSLGVVLNYLVSPITTDVSQQLVVGVSTEIVQAAVFSDLLTYEPANNAWLRSGAPAASVSDNIVSLYGTYSNSITLTPGGLALVPAGLACSGSPASLDCSSVVKQPFGNANYYPPNAWSYTYPSLNYARSGHTANLLPDGRVVVMGGLNGTGTLDTGEYMNPASSSKAWTLAGGKLSVSRENHTATLMPNGNLLIAGGYTQAASTGPVSNADIFYPYSNTIVQASSMTVARQNHTAVMLPFGPSAGDIMVIGGKSPTAYLNTSEIYISTSNLWIQLGGAMTYSRSHHTSTILQNGNILVAGGLNANGEVGYSEIFNPSTMTWGSVAKMQHARHDHTATLLSSGLVLVVGGNDSSGEVFEAEVYDPVAGAWSSLSPTDLLYSPIPGRMRHTASLLPNGNVMFLGGATNGGSSLQYNSIYYPEVNLLADDSSAILTPPRALHTTTVLPDGNVLAIGGFDGSSYLSTVTNAYFQPIPDAYDSPSERTPLLSTATASTQFNVVSSTMPYPYFNNISTVTLLSGNASFFGITDANAGNTGTSTHSMPRIYTYMTDTASGFMLDLSTYVYSAYGNNLNSFTNVPSSITIVTPQMPYGWYNYRVATNSIFSKGYTVCVSSPLPAGTVSNIIGMPPQPAASTTQPTSSGLSTTQINWSWTLPAIASYVDGYNVYSSSNGVYLTQLSNATANYTTTIGTNTPVNIELVPFNISATGGGVIAGTTYYTYAAMPSTPTITAASFNSAALSWSANGNPSWTPYEIDVSKFGCRSTADSCYVANSTNTDHELFSSVYTYQNLTGTGWTIPSLATNTTWYFRIRARNGDGSQTVTPLGSNATYYYLNTDFSGADSTGLYISTLTIGSIGAITASTGTASSITWTWPSVSGINVTYNVYSSTLGVLGTVTNSTFTYSNLNPNTTYFVYIQPISGNASGAPAVAPTTYTMPFTPQADPVCSTGTVTSDTGAWVWVTSTTMTGYWLNGNTNGYNPSGTSYLLELSTCNFVTTTNTCGYATQTVTYNAGDNECMNGSIASLSPDQPYQMRISAISNASYASNTSRTSLTMGTTYTLSIPPSSFAAANITTSSTTLTWNNPNSPATPSYSLSYSTGTMAMPTAQGTAFYNCTAPISYSAYLSSTTDPSTGVSTVTFSAATVVKVSTSGTTIAYSSCTLVNFCNSANNLGQEILYYPNYQISTVMAPVFLETFSSSYTATAYELKGLLTGTTYWMNIQTQNGGGVLTSTTTLSNNSSNAGGYFVSASGPAGIPSGSIVGYAGDGTISGTFPDGRKVVVTVPSNAYTNKSTQIGIAEMGTNPCSSSICKDSNGKNVYCPTFGLYTTNNLNPLVPIQFSFYYNTYELSGIDKTTLVMARDNGNGNCAGLQTTVDTTNLDFASSINHLPSSHQFQLEQVTAPGDANEVNIYPNPFYPSRGQGYVTFDNLPTPASVRIYTLSGAKVWEGSKSTVSPLIWYGKNSSGENVASGIYLAVVNSNSGKKIFKVAVER